VTETERDRIKALEVKMEGYGKEQQEMKTLLKELVADMHKRQGREEAERIEHVEGREDKWQMSAWVRALIPFGIITAMFTALWNEVWRFFTGAPQ
jgi:hypothetical protein